MNKFNSLLSAVVKLLLIIFLGFAILAVIQLKGVLAEVKTSVQLFTADTHRKLFDKGEVLDIIKKTLLHVDQASGETALLIKREHVSSEKLNEKLIGIAGKTDDTIEALHIAINNLTIDAGKISSDTHLVLIALNKDLDDLDPILVNTKKAIADLDENLINDPDIKESLKEIAGITKNVNGITGNLNLMSTDVEKKFHQLLTAKPTLKTKILLALKLVYQAALIRSALEH